MCGRFTITAPFGDIARLLRAPVIGHNLPAPAIQVRPTDRIPVALESLKEPGRRLEAARWDLARPGAKTLQQPGRPLINVRSETAATKFAWALNKRRCLIPANGYFEWTGPKNARQPWYLHRPDGMLVVAGVYSWWLDLSAPEEDPHRWVLTAAMLTTDADERLGQIHDRTPVMLSPEAWDMWLDPHNEDGPLAVHEAVEASRSVTSELEFHQVKPFSTMSNDPGLTDPIG